MNQNDFLIADEDLAWLRSHFDSEHLTVFAEGGHLGNLGNSDVKQAILKTLTTMRSPQTQPVDSKVP